MAIRPSPNLWLAIFDPVSELEQALDSGYLSLNPINANAMSSINLNLNLIQLLNGTQMYYYSAWKLMVCRFRMLMRTYSSLHLDNPVSKFGLRYQQKRQRLMYYNFVPTIYELDSNDQGAEASYDLDGMY